MLGDRYLTPIKNAIAEFVQGNPWTGYVIAFGLIAIFLLYQFANIWPGFKLLKAEILTPLAKRWKFKRLVKAAQSSQIEGTVNTMVRKIKGQLPKGWIPEVEIEWVDFIGRDDFLKENEVVIRMRPLEDQDSNLVNAIYYFFKKNCFPKTKTVIGENYREAAILSICKNLINKFNPKLKSSFEDYVLEPVVGSKSNLLNFMDRYDKLDQRGFFTGSFIREIQEIATEAKFTHLRSQINTEVQEILKHTEEFISVYDSQSHKIPPANWNKIGPITKYSFLLVARPDSSNIEPYLNRAREKQTQGISRLYVFGTKEENAFAKKVISHIAKLPNFKMVEQFQLSNDYRGQSGGIGALFSIKND
jgi:hypothetical protein